MSCRTGIWLVLFGEYELQLQEVGRGIGWLDRATASGGGWEGNSEAPATFFRDYWPGTPPLLSVHVKNALSNCQQTLEVLRFTIYKICLLLLTY